MISIAEHYYYFFFSIIIQNYQNENNEVNAVKNKKINK